MCSHQGPLSGEILKPEGYLKHGRAMITDVICELKFIFRLNIFLEIAPGFRTKNFLLCCRVGELPNYSMGDRTIGCTNEGDDRNCVESH